MEEPKNQNYFDPCTYYVFEEKKMIGWSLKFFEEKKNTMKSAQNIKKK